LFLEERFSGTIPRGFTGSYDGATIEHSSRFGLCLIFKKSLMDNKSE
jgi:hypothetical protein